MLVYDIGKLIMVIKDTVVMFPWCTVQTSEVALIERSDEREAYGHSPEVGQAFWHGHLRLYLKRFWQSCDLSCRKDPERLRTMVLISPPAAVASPLGPSCYHFKHRTLLLGVVKLAIMLEAFYDCLNRRNPCLGRIACADKNGEATAGRKKKSS